MSYRRGGRSPFARLRLALGDSGLYAGGEHLGKPGACEAELPAVAVAAGEAVAADAPAVAHRIPLGMLLAVLPEREVPVPRVAEVRRAERDPAAPRGGDRLAAVAVEAVPDERPHVVRRGAPDVALEEVRPAAHVEGGERERLRLRHVLVAVMPPVHAAFVFEQVVHGVERAAHAAAGEDDVAPERLDGPFLVRKRIRSHALAARERGVTHVERRLAGVADGHSPVGREALPVVAELLHGRLLPRLRRVRHLYLVPMSRERGKRGECRRNR